ncbi:MAG: hypothetical protein HQL45_16170 [Alphaproteobacteria bacterium]|nr:hypothetical protein [Alphaproteobacteria bacterium]
MDQHEPKTAPTLDKPKRNRAKALALLGLVAGALYAAPLLSDLGSARASGGGKFGGGGGSGVISQASDPATVKECGSCHMAYAPSSLPEGSWREIMGNLKNHFGEDASISQQLNQQITNYLVNYSGGRGTGPLKITETNWFVREHGRKVASRGAAKLSNCGACHQIQGQTQTNRGRF